MTDEALDFLPMQGFRRCDIAACNCGSWHGGNANERLREVADLLRERGAWRGTVLSLIETLLDKDSVKA